MAVFVNPTSCGFAKVVLHLTRLNKLYVDDNSNEQVLDNTNASEKLERYCSFFLSRKEKYEVDLRTFRNGMTKLKQLIDKMSKYKANDKRSCFETFAPINFTQ